MPAPAKAATPPWGVGRTILDIAVPVGAGIVTVQLSKALIRRGNIPAAIASIAGASLFTSAVEGGIQAISNTVRGQNVGTGVGDRMIAGLRLGAITGAVAVVSPRIEGAINGRLPRLHPIAQVALGNASGAAIGGALRTASNSETWQYGVGRGLRRIGTMAALSAGTGIVGGVAIKSATHFRVLPKVSWLPYPFNA